MEDFIPIVDLGNGTGFIVLDTLLNTARTPPETQKVAAFTAAIEKKTDRPVLVVVPSPVDRVAQALVRGTVPSQAVSEWVTEIQLFLDDALKAWRRILLIDEMALLQASELMSEELGSRLGLELEAVPPAAAPLSAPEHAVYAVLARYMIEELPEFRDLAGQLSSLTLGSGWQQGPDLAALDHLYAHLQDPHQDRDASQSDLGAARDQQVALEAEANQLRSGLFEMRSQVEADMLERKLLLEEGEAHRRAHNADLRRRQHRETVLGTEILALGRENRMLRQSLTAAVSGQEEVAREVTHVTQKLQDRDTRITKLRATLEEVKEELTQSADQVQTLQASYDQARNELEHIYQSKSWKAVSAMRAARHVGKK